MQKAMATQHDDKKVWIRPMVQTLNINRDTYGLGNKSRGEQGQGNGEDQKKTVS
jgi:hypothetical protein